MGESNRSKNLKLASWDGGDTWYLQVYDSDTTISLDNSGFIKFDPDIEVGDLNVYNTTSSRLWSKVLLLMENDIKTTYAEMRQNGLSLDNIMECIIEEQIDKIPATYYNKDMQTKYLDFGNTYLYALHGNDKQHIKLWLEERLLYLDTLWDYDASVTDFVSLRSSKLGNIYLDIETFKTMYLKVKWRNDTTGASTQKLRIVKNSGPTRFSFESKTETDQEIRIYGGQYIKSLGDLSNLEPTTITLIQAPKVNSLICHSDKLINTDVSSCVNLSRVDLSGCINLGSGTATATVLDVSACTELEYLNIQNTALQGIELNPRGSNIRELYYPKNIENISLNNCPRLESINLMPENTCKEMKIINCPNIKEFGDREYDKTTDKYKYENGYFLSGIQSVYLDNSAIGLEYFDITYCKNLQSVILKNMPKIKAIYIGINEIDAKPISGQSNSYSRTYDLSKVKEAISLDFEIVNVPKLNEFYITCSARKSAKDKINYGCNASVLILNTLDLSKLPIENLYIYNNVEIYKLLLPTTLKNIIRHPYIDFDGSPNPYAWNYKINWNEESPYKLDPYNNVYWYALFNNNQSSIGGAGCHLTARNGGFIHNMYCPKIKGDNFELPASSPYLWDFEGLDLGEALFYGENITTGGNALDTRISTYSDNKVDIKNLNCKPKNYVTHFNNTWINSVQGKLDLSEYRGLSLQYALAFTTDLDVILPSNLDNLDTVKYWGGFLNNTNSQILTWDIVGKLINKVSNPYDLARSFLNNTILKEQESEDEAIDIIVKCGEVPHSYSFDFTNNSNIKYVKTLDVKHYWGVLGNNKYITKIEKAITFGINSFNGCTNLEYVGEVVLGCMESKDTFTLCTSLEQPPIIKVKEGITLTDISSFFNSCNNMRGVVDFSNVSLVGLVSPNSNNGSLVSSFLRCYNIEKIIFNDDIMENMNSISLNDTFCSCNNLISIEGLTSIPLRTLSSRQTFYECYSLETLLLPNCTVENIYLTNIESMYSGTKLQIDKFTVPPQVGNLNYLFLGCDGLTNFIFDMSLMEKKVTSLQRCLGAKSFTEVTIILPNKAITLELPLLNSRYNANADVHSPNLYTLNFDFSNVENGTYLSIHGITLNLPTNATINGLDLGHVQSYTFCGGYNPRRMLDINFTGELTYIGEDKGINFEGFEYNQFSDASKQSFLEHVGIVSEDSPCKTIYGGTKLFTQDQIAILTSKGWIVT